LNQPQELPIFPLGTVLYPDGRLPLRIFEPRYVEMTRECLRTGSGFGVCLILDGREAGEPAVPHTIGCSASVVEREELSPGLFNLLARGDTRFRILERRVAADGLIHAQVEWLNTEAPIAVPEDHLLAPLLLQRLINEVGVGMVPMPHRLDDAAWVTHRLAEILPLPLAAKQRILECDDSLEKLEIVMRQLRSIGDFG